VPSSWSASVGLNAVPQAPPSAWTISHSRTQQIIHGCFVHRLTRTHQDAEEYRYYCAYHDYLGCTFRAMSCESLGRFSLGAMRSPCEAARCLRPSPAPARRLLRGRVLLAVLGVLPLPIPHACGCCRPPLCQYGLQLDTLSSKQAWSIALRYVLISQYLCFKTISVQVLSYLGHTWFILRFGVST
jgi:hypothetical protein